MRQGGMRQEGKERENRKGRIGKANMREVSKGKTNMRKCNLTPNGGSSW
jgi:hypothetical protein